MEVRATSGIGSSQPRTPRNVQGKVLQSEAATRTLQRISQPLPMGRGDQLSGACQELGTRPVNGGELRMMEEGIDLIFLY